MVDLCGALAECGHEVTLATLFGAEHPPNWGDGSPRRPRVIRVSDRAVRKKIMKTGILRMREFASETGLREFDVLHVHGVWDYWNIQVCAFARKCGVPYVVSCRGMLDDWSMRQSKIRKRVFLGVLGSLWLRRAAGIHFTSAGEQQQSSRWIRGRAEAVIPNLLDLRPFGDLPGAAAALERFPTVDGCVRILFISRLHPKKGLDLLLRAVSILMSEGEPVSLLIAGSGDVKYVSAMRALAGALGLDEGRCKFLGQVSGAIKLSLYQSSDLVVLPTYQENFGFVFFEALACGVPLITTTGADVWQELHASGGATILSDVDPREVASGVRSLIHDPSRRHLMGKRGREWVFEELEASRLVSKFESMYFASSVGHSAWQA